jgi:hypothetical protein
MAAITSPDPTIPIEEGEMPSDEYAAHVRTFHAFLSVTRWFVIHLFIILVALYFGAIADRPAVAGALVLVSIGLLIYGFLRRPSIRADLRKGLAAGPGAPARKTIDRHVSEGDRTA